MRDMNGGEAEALMQAFQLMPHGQPDLGIEVGERFVEQQDRRIHRQRPAERNTLALPAGQGCHLAVAIALQPEQVENLGNLAVAIGALIPRSFSP